MVFLIWIIGVQVEVTTHTKRDDFPQNHEEFFTISLSYHCHITVISLSYHPTDIRSTPNHRRWPPRTHYGTRFHLKNYPEPWFPQWFRINTHKQYPPSLNSTPFCWATSVKTRSWGHDSSTHFVASRMAVPEAVLQGYDDEMNSICDIITHGWKKSTLIK